ncbi:MAG: ATP phosphoribosyltransferase regulatory subunit [Pseudomonadota bacterium]
MTEQAEKGLLPAGLGDVLAPSAAHEFRVIGQLLHHFQAQGYDQIKPPLLEFEEGLLSGTGAAVSSQTFRLMDPISHRMMGLRADMTPQIVRIAATRLEKSPRPLRLCYSGQVLQVRGSQLRPERQFAQVGAELIGASQAEADVEVALLAADSLRQLGIEGLSLDINMPPLVGGLTRDLGLDDGLAHDLRAALDRKDAASVSELAGPHHQVFISLLQAAGPAEASLRAIQALDLPPSATQAVARLADVVNLLKKQAPHLELTLDPVEHRGFEYQTGTSFILFAKGVRGELGRGGRYESRPVGQQSAGESATGFSLFMDTVLRALGPATAPDRVYLPFGHDAARAAALRGDGWVTVSALGDDSDATQEARRLGCSHILQDNQAMPLTGDPSKEAKES